MYVVCEDSGPQNLYTDFLPLRRGGESDIIGHDGIDASDASPGVPGDVREHLKSPMH
jgi:hypothetical protein